jgi:hypothetical protein
MIPLYLGRPDLSRRRNWGITGSRAISKAAAGYSISTAHNAHFEQHRSIHRLQTHAAQTHDVSTTCALLTFLTTSPSHSSPHLPEHKRQWSPQQSPNSTPPHSRGCRSRHQKRRLRLSRFLRRRRERRRGLQHLTCQSTGSSQPGPSAEKRRARSRQPGETGGKICYPAPDGWINCDCNAESSYPSCSGCGAAEHNAPVRRLRLRWT